MYGFTNIYSSTLLTRGVVLAHVLVIFTTICLWLFVIFYGKLLIDYMLQAAWAFCEDVDGGYLFQGGPERTTLSIAIVFSIWDVDVWGLGTIGG